MDADTARAILDLATTGRLSVESADVVAKVLWADSEPEDDSTKATAAKATAAPGRRVRDNPQA